MNLCRIIKHGNMGIKGPENFVLKFDGNTAHVNIGGNITIAPIDDLKNEIMAIGEQAEIFLMESIEVDFAPGFLDYQLETFREVTPILGMIYFDVLPTYIGQRYTPDFVVQKTPPVALLNKTYCPGIPIQLDQNLVMQLVSKAPVLYVPTDEVNVVENINSAG